jgi:hypothetical protein
MIMIKFENMKIVNAILIAGCLALVLTSCMDDEIVTCEPLEGSTLKLTVQPTFGAQDLHLDSTYTTAEGYKVQFTEIKFYIQDVKNGSVTMISDGLFDFRSRGTLLLEASGDPLDFAGLQANLGVDSSINHDNPSEFPNSSWLNISNSNDMHWGWNPGYIFVKIEAKADTIADGNDVFDHNVVFHVGLDANMQTLDYTNLNWLALGNDVHELQFGLDLATFLQGSTQSIDLQTEFSSHSAPGQEALTLKVMENFKEALTLL